jgi:hypothetical protein
MTIRVHGPGVTGKTVHIQSPKCTIGSAEGCTLRLRSAGVEAANCWILRGPGGAIIRRLDGAAMLNGQSFDEALLEPGDRLQLGSVELELVKLRSDTLARPSLAPPPAAASPPPPAASQEAEGRLAAAAQLAASQASELETLRQQLAQKHAADTALRTAADMARRELAAQSAAMLRREHELTELRNTAAAERQAWANERGALETQLAQLAAELRAARAAAVADSTMTVPLSRCSPADSELQSRCSELEQQVAQLQTRNQDLQAQAELQASLEHRCQQLSLELDTRCREYADLQARESATAARTQSQADLDQRAEALARWQDELTQRSDRLTASEQQLNEQRQALESQRGELDAERRRLAAEQNELTADRQRLLTEQAALAADRDAIAAERAALAASQLESSQAAQADAHSAAEKLQAREERLERQAEELTQWSNSLAEQAESLNQQAAELQALRQQLNADADSQAQKQAALAPAELSAELPAEAAAELSAEAPADAEPPAAADSSSVDSVLSRLVQAGLWRQDESDKSAASDAHSDEPLANEPLANEPPTASPINHDTAVPLSPFAPAPEDAPGATMHFDSPPLRPAAAPSHDEEESIESYMERLMQRVRGDSPPPSPAQRLQSAPPKPAVSESAKAPPAPGPAAPAAAPPQPGEPGEFVPRSTAPETGSNLSAMRELANTAARSAIDHHIRRHTNRQAMGKLLGAGVCLAAGGFLGYTAWQQPTSLTIAGATLSLSLAALWFATGLRNLSKARQLDRSTDPAPAPAA